MTITHAMAAQSLGLIKPLSVIESVRMSYHSLIGDLWVAAILGNQFKATSLKDNPAPHLFFWDSDIPAPNTYTALAWYLILENPIGYYFHVVEDNEMWQLPRTSLAVAPPESPHHGHLGMEFDTFDSSLDEPITMHDAGPYLGRRVTAEYRSKLRMSDRNSLPRLYNPNHVIAPSALHSIDVFAEDMPPHFMRSLLMIRYGLHSEVLVHPRMPMTLASFDQRGAWMTPFTSYGMAVKPLLRVKADGTTEPVRESFSSPVLLSQSIEDVTLSHVPYATPPLWFGFTYTDKSADSFMAAYFSVREQALAQLFGTAAHPGVIQPQWEDILGRKGLMASQVVKKKPESTGSKVKIKGLDLANFDLESILNQGE